MDLESDGDSLLMIPVSAYLARLSSYKENLPLLSARPASAACPSTLAQMKKSSLCLGFVTGK